MRILLLVHSFNSLSQRLYVELARDGHEITVELDIHDRVTCEAADLFRPDVVLAPFLKRAIPQAVWRRYLSLIVHPGPPGDRGPSALDWAILRGVLVWGVTVLAADADWDAGAVWSSASFAMRLARKSSLYRNEVTEGTVAAVRAALKRVAAGAGPLPATIARGEFGWQPPLRQAQRAIDWERDDTATVLRKIHSADGFPGLQDRLCERIFRLYDARAERHLTGPPGTLIARRNDAVCRATGDGAVWIGQLAPMDNASDEFKRPAVLALGPLAQGLPPHGEVGPAEANLSVGDGEIRYEERGAVGYLHFEFYNGALSTTQCARLRETYAYACQRPTRVIALMGGTDFWCNGMHLHCIEAAASPADASWVNINAIDDLARDILTTRTHLTIAALQGNTAAGGVFLALACDRVVAHSGVVLNPHYRNMGNLYGSKYWTYSLPRRIGMKHACDVMARRLPLGVPEAQAIGLIDDYAGPGLAAFHALIAMHADNDAAGEGFVHALTKKNARRDQDERDRPLADYRSAELARMRMNFYGFDPSYHIARHRFVHRAAHAWTPLHLAAHRRMLANDGREAALA